MKKEKTHDNISRFFFVIGFIANMLYHVVPAFVGQICKFISIGCNYGGYLFWLTSAQVSADQERVRKKWYAFTSIKNQHRLTSILGGLATTLALIGIFVPVLLIPAFWLFTVSNLIWIMTTYHQRKQPPKDDPSYSPRSFTNYFKYVVLNTISSIITAIATTLIFVFPLATPLILLISLAINALITMGSLYFLIESVTDTKPRKSKAIQYVPPFNQSMKQLYLHNSPKPTNSLIEELQHNKKHVYHMYDTGNSANDVFSDLKIEKN